METLRIYRISDHYVRFLHDTDNRVQFNKGNRRPYVGIVLTVGQYRYFVPMESPKPNHVNIKSGKHIFRLDGGRLGLLGFNNMLPVPDSALIAFDISQEPDPQYSDLLKRQASFCNRHKADILSHASSTYYDVVNNKSEFMKKICCDFKKLESACSNYNPNFKSKKPR